MFVETITAPRDEWERFNERLRTLDDPPPALFASVVWEADGQVTTLNVWDSPEAVGDFFLERVHPAIQALGEPANKPKRHGEPLHVYVRGVQSHR